VPAIVPAIESESLYALRNGVKYIPRFSAANYKLPFATLRFAASLKLVRERASVSDESEETAMHLAGRSRVEIFN